MKHPREGTMIERIEAGCYDDKLDIIMSNSDRLHNYPVWKAANQRKLLVANGSRLPKSTQPQLPNGIRCSVCTPAQRPYAEAIGQMLDKLIKLYPNIRMTIGYGVYTIKADYYMHKPVVTTRIGTEEHYATFAGGRDLLESDMYIVGFHTEGFDDECYYFEDFAEAQAKLFEVLRDEDLC